MTRWQGTTTGKTLRALALPTALAAALRRLRDDSAFRLRLGTAARSRALAEVTESVMADRYARVFDA